MVVGIIAFLSINADRTDTHLPSKVMRTITPMMPAITRICVAANGLYCCIPNLLKTMPSACPSAPPKANSNPVIGLLTATFLFLPSGLNMTTTIPVRVMNLPLCLWLFSGQSQHCPSRQPAKRLVPFLSILSG